MKPIASKKYLKSMQAELLAYYIPVREAFDLLPDPIQHTISRKPKALNSHVNFGPWRWNFFREHTRKNGHCSCAFCGVELTHAVMLLFHEKFLRAHRSHPELAIDLGFLNSEGFFQPMTVDHILPHSLGGSHEQANLQPACGACNAKKRNEFDTIDLIYVMENFDSVITRNEESPKYKTADEIKKILNIEAEKLGVSKRL